MEGELHKRAIHIIDKWLRGLMPGYEIRIKARKGVVYKSYSDIMQGVEHIRIPDDSNDLLPIGGYPEGGVRTPDIMLLDSKINPIRVIEVEVTSPIPPSKNDYLRKRGVQVVEVRVGSESDLTHNVFRLKADGYNSTFRPLRDPKEITNNAQSKAYRDEIRFHDGEINQLIDSLRQCRPETRRKLKEILDVMDTVDSYYPTGYRVQYKGRQ